MVAVARQAEAHVVGAEERFVLEGIPWATYVALRDALDESSRRMRLTYLEGRLELMGPSLLHEDVKTIIARLLEIWSLERRVDLRGFGAATFRREAAQRGLEPDECYKLGKLEDEGVPDIAIEVTISRGLLDKLDVYAGLGVPEVWTWRTGGPIVVHRLVEGRYQRRERSEIVPALDIAQLSAFVRPGSSHLELVEAYVAALRGR